MDTKEIARALLQILTKQQFRNQSVKSKLKELGLLSENGNVTKSGKAYIWNYYGDTSGLISTTSL